MPSTLPTSSHVSSLGRGAGPVPARLMSVSRNETEEVTSHHRRCFFAAEPGHGRRTQPPDKNDSPGNLPGWTDYLSDNAPAAGVTTMDPGASRVLLLIEKLCSVRGSS